MKNSKIASVKLMFASHLDTLEHLIKMGEKHYGDKSETTLGYQLTPDMLPFGTQIVFACNQPHNFSRWCEGKQVENIDPNVQTISQAQEIITNVKKDLNRISGEDSKFDETIMLELGDNMYVELSGVEYLEEFLIPNFYFHLVTAYNILRMSGVQIGKHDYMMHLVPKVRQREA